MACEIGGRSGLPKWMARKTRSRLSTGSSENGHLPAVGVPRAAGHHGPIPRCRIAPPHVQIHAPLLFRRQPEAVVAGVKSALRPFDPHLRIKRRPRPVVADPHLDAALVRFLAALRNEF